jgi:hypothetical protein
MLYQAMTYSKFRRNNMDFTWWIILFVVVVAILIYVFWRILSTKPSGSNSVFGGDSHDDYGYNEIDEEDTSSSIHGSDFGSHTASSDSRSARRSSPRSSHDSRSVRRTQDRGMSSRSEDVVYVPDYSSTPVVPDVASPVHSEGHSSSFGGGDSHEFAGGGAGGSWESSSHSDSISSGSDSGGDSGGGGDGGGGDGGGGGE